MKLENHEGQEQAYGKWVGRVNNKYDSPIENNLTVIPTIRF